MPRRSSEAAIKRINRIAAGAALLVALFLPSVYFGLSYQFMSGVLNAEADFSSHRASQIIAGVPQMWRFESERLEGILERRSDDGQVSEQKIYATDNQLIATNEIEVDSPAITRSRGIYDSGRQVGRVEVSQSLRPLMFKTFSVALLGICLGALIFFSFRVLPLRTLREALDRLDRNREIAEVTAKIARTVGSTLQPQELFRAILQEILEFIPCEQCVIACFDPQTSSFRLWHRESTVASGRRTLLKDNDDFTRWLRETVYESNQRINIPDIQLLGLPWSTYWSETGIRSFLFVPVVQDHRAIAHIALSHTTVGAFSERDEELLQSVASHIGPAIRNAALHNEAEERAERLARLAELSQQVAKNLDLGEIFESVARITAEFTRSNKSRVFLYNEAQNQYNLCASFGSIPDEGKLSFKPTEGIIGDCALKGEAMISADVQKDPRWVNLEWVQTYDIHGYLAYPVHLNGKTVLIISCISQKVGAFDQEDLDLLGTLAPQVAIAIENANLYQDSEEKGKRLATLIGATQRLTRGLDLPSVLHSIVDSASSLFKGEAGFRLMEGEHLVRVAATPYALEVMKSERILVGESSSGWVAQNGKPFTTSDAKSDPLIIPRHRGNVQDDRTGALMVIPVKLGYCVLGTLNIYREKGYVFDDDHIELATSLADQAAISIENARLLGEAQRSRNFFRSVFADNADAILLVDPDLVVTHWNVGAERLFGYSEEESLGQTLEHLIPEKDREKLYRTQEAVFQNGQPFRYDADRLRKDGTSVPVSVTISPIRDEKGNVIAATVTYKDLTERRQLEETLRLRAKQQEAVANLGRMGLSGEVLEKLMQEAAILLSRTLQVEHATVLKLLPDQNQLLICAGYGWKEGIVGNFLVSPDDHSQTGYTLKSSMPVIMEDVREENQFIPAKLFYEHNIVSGMSIIIQGIDHPFGILSVHSTKKRLFSQDDVFFLEAAANVLAESVKRLQAEEALRSSEERFRHLVEFAADAILVHDFEGNLVNVNQQACESLGYTREELLQLNVRDIELMYNGVIKRQQKHEYPLMEPKTFEGIHQRKDGTTFPVEARLGKFELNGRELIVALVRDVTERREAEEKLLFALGEAEAASRAKSEFLSTMSHELRSPLNAVIGFSDILMRDSQDEMAQILSPKIRDAGRHLLSLIEEILDLDRIEVGKVHLHIESVSINDLTASLVETWQSRLSDGFSLSMERDPNCNVVQCDRTRIEQVLNNLIDNAVKYSPEGGNILVRTQAFPDEIQISVQDEGMGISPEALESIFDRFHQLEKGYARRAGGLGIGLALAREIIEMHGGSIWAESEDGKGSLFTIALPLVSEEVNSTTTSAGDGEVLPREDEPWKGRTILIVDDVEHYHEYMKLLMRSASRLESVFDGFEAIEAARHVHPDLILMDLRMPHLDGFETIERLKSNPDTKDIPILAVTAQAMEEDRERAIRSGADGFVTKPVHPGILQNEMQRILQARV